MSFNFDFSETQTPTEKVFHIDKTTQSIIKDAAVSLTLLAKYFPTDAGGVLLEDDDLYAVNNTITRLAKEMATISRKANILEKIPF